MIERRKESAGQFTIPLRPEASQQTIDRLNLATAGFALIAVLAGHVQVSAFTPAQLVALARYVGVYRTIADDDSSIQGAGLAILLGDEDGKGPLTTAASAGTTDRTFQQWITFLPSILSGDWNGLSTTGNIEAIAGTQRIPMPPGVTARTWLDQVCLQFGAEWRAKNDLTLHAGTPAYLYPTVTTPTTLVSRAASSRDVNIRGLQATIGGQSDVEDFTTRVQLHYAADTAFESASLAVNPYFSPDGTPLAMQRVVDGNAGVNASNAATVAARNLAKYDSVRKAIDVEIDTYDIFGDVVDGDMVWVYDPKRGFVGPTQIAYRGRIVFPVPMRVHSVASPVQQGMGVYLIIGGTPGTAYDLTNDVAPEDGPSRLEVGAPPRKLVRAIRRGETV